MISPFSLKFIVLLYADDTMILANNESNLQFSLDRFNAYCLTWKLKANIEKKTQNLLYLEQEKQSRIPHG